MEYSCKIRKTNRKNLQVDKQNVYFKALKMVPLEPALKYQYKSLMIKNLKCNVVEQNEKTSIILVFWFIYCV